MKKAAISFWLAAAFLVAPVRAQRGGGGRGGPAAPAEEGIPVTSQVVIDKCGSCHAKDDKGNLSRISWERSTPEGWEEAIKRMVRLNGVELTPPDARAILKYLSTYHGLAPEEAKPVMYIAEHRILDEAIPNETVRTTCMSCHPLGKAFSWRRSKDDWKLLTNMHSAFFAQADAVFRRSAAPEGGGGRGGRGGAAAPAAAPASSAAPSATPSATASSTQGNSGAQGSGGTQAMPVDETVDFLGRTYPLHTPEWSAWRARMRTPRIAGRWLVSAYIPARGKYFGEMVLTAGAAEDEFTTRIKLQSIKDGSTIIHTGQGLVYAGYSWRGRSKAVGAQPNPSPDSLSQDMREVMWISPDQSQAEGRWFWGAYQEFGVEVKMQRAGDGPVLLGPDRFSLKAGSQAQSIRLVGDSLPAGLEPADLDFGSGVTVRRVVSQSPAEVVAEVDVAADAVPGKRDISLRRLVAPNAIAVYDRVDYLKVVPQSTIARLGSETHPKGYQQFEAIGYQRGADGKTYTADDVDLGPVDATWKVEEFYAVFGDDDKEFVGSLSLTGFFTPALDGPNPQRKFSRNNYGDIWVVATSKEEKDKHGNLLSGKSYLVVTVPAYIMWDQPEVAQ